MSVSLYGLSQEFRAFEEVSNEIEFDDETGEIIDNTDTLKQLFEELECNYIDKLDSCQYIRKELEGKADLLAAEIKRLQARKKALERKIILFAHRRPLKFMPPDPADEKPEIFDKRYPPVPHINRR